MKPSKALKEKKFAWVAVTHPEGGFTLGAAIENEPGYHPSNYPSVDTYEKAAEWARVCNERLGINADRAFEIQISSMTAGKVNR